MGLNNLDLNLLKTFVWVAEEKSFTKAAKKLFTEQSSVSKAIKRLEREIGTALFLRTKRRVQLTTKGMGLLPIAKSILHSSENLLRYASDKENELSGTLKFGAVSPISFLLMPEVISKITENYPRLWPMMFTGITDDTVQRVKERKIEFAFLDYEGNRIKDLEYKELGHWQFRIVASTKINTDAMNSFIGSREIHDDQSPKLPTFEKIKKINKDIRIKYSANDMMAYKSLILSGLGIGLMPEIFVREEIKQKKLKILYPEITLRFPIFVAHHGSYPLTLEALRMIEVFSKKLMS